MEDHPQCDYRAAEYSKSNEAAETKDRSKAFFI